MVAHRCTSVLASCDFNFWMVAHHCNPVLADKKAERAWFTITHLFCLQSLQAERNRMSCAHNHPHKLSSFNLFLICSQAVSVALEAVADVLPTTPLKPLFHVLLSLNKVGFIVSLSPPRR